VARWFERSAAGLRLCVVLLLTVILAPAQSSEPGGITGVVKDPSGAVVCGATVEVYNEETGVMERRVTTDADGLYAARLLRPGPYRVEVTDQGFGKHVTELTVRLNELERHDVILQVATLRLEVSVRAAGTLVNTENPTTGQPIDNHTLTTLPLAEPNYLFLLGLSTGTSTEPPDVRTSGRSTVDVSVNGQRTTNNSMTVEGINVDDFNLAHFDYLPIPDSEAIQDFKVATSLYDASLGSKGGGALALVLKSGTKDLHWELYGTTRNDALNANEWFRAHANQPRARLIQNVMGGQASGPFPLLKGFWFANAQATRGRNGVDPNTSNINPTIAAFATNPDGSTSAALIAAQYGLSPAQIDPVAVKILNAKGNYYGGTYLIPRPGQPGCSSFVAPPTSPGNPGTFSCNFSRAAAPSDTQFSVAYDRPLRQAKDKLQVRTFYDNIRVLKPFGTMADLAGPLNEPLDNRFASLSYTTQISSRQLNEMRFGVSRFVFALKPTDLLTLQDVGATRPNSAAFPGLYFFVPGPFSLGIDYNDDRGVASNTYELGDSWLMTIGRHNVHAGGDLTRYQLNRYLNSNVRGAVAFFQAGSSYPTDWLNFITGTVTAASAGAGDSKRYFRAFSPDLYLQDDYRWSSRLTLNLGLRWEPMQFAHDLFHRNANYDFRRAQQGLNPFLFPAALNLNGVTGTPGVSDCALRHCWDSNNFAPRAGFAWDIFGNHQTVLRGGYGIYFQQLSNQTEFQGSIGAPFFVTQNFFNFNGVSLLLANPLPNQATGTTKLLPQYVPGRSYFVGVNRDVNDPAATVNWVNQTAQTCQLYFVPADSGPATNCSIDLASFPSADPSLHSPYTQQWNLTLQRLLRHNWAVEIGYIGSHGIGGIAVWRPFQARLASQTAPINVEDMSGKPYTITTNTLANETLREQALGLTGLTGAAYTSNIGNQIYHSAQFILSHRFQSGLFFQAGYTFAKNIDNVSGSVNTYELNGSPGRGGAGAYNDQSNISGNRAVSDLDRRHRLSIAHAYELPVARAGMFATQVLQGWGISGLLTLQSGQPFTVGDSFAGGAYGFPGGTPSAVCGSSQITALPGDAPLATCIPGQATNPLAAPTSGPIQRRLDDYINPNFFSHPAPVPFAGDSSSTGFGSPSMRNIYRGPFQESVDFSIMKNFHIGERHRIQFRTDFFNLFNHPVFSIPTCTTCLDLNASPANFSKITQTVIPARLIQFGLKYSF
jgi:Carboxypeptidase regulatory-like domain/TonB dependent receptor